MSGSGCAKDTRREPCAHTVARVLVAQPGLLTADYVRLVLGHRPGAIKAALHRLKVAGYATTTRYAGMPGKGQWQAVTWTPTPLLVRLLERGGMPAISRHQRATDALEDDGWTPPTQYIGGTRAVILGLRKRAA